MAWYSLGFTGISFVLWQISALKADKKKEEGKSSYVEDRAVLRGKITTAVMAALTIMAFIAHA